MAIEIGAVRASASLDATSFTAGARDVRQTLRVLQGGFQETSRDAVRSVEAMAQATDASLTRVSRAAQKEVNALLGVDRATQKASATTRAWVSQLDQQARGFDRLKASLDPVFASSKQYETALDQVEKAVRSGIVSQEEANRVLDQAAQKYLGLVPAAEAAAKAKEKETQQAKNMRSSYESLRASVDPLYASSRRYEAIQRQMNTAVAAGVVTQKEAALVLDRAADQYLGAGAAAAAYGKKAQAGTFHTANMVAQFNDMGVMMAAGQSPWLLALQQGTQFNQILMQLRGTGASTFSAIRTAVMATVSPMALLTIGTIAGVAALGQWAMSALGAGEDAEAMKKRVDELEASLAAVDKQLDLSSKGFADLQAEFFGGEEGIRSLLAAQRDFDLGKVIGQAKELASVLAQKYPENPYFNRSRVEKLQAAFGLLRKDTIALGADLDALGKAEGLEAQLEAARHMREHFFAMVGSQEALTGSRAEFYETLIITEAALSRALAKQKEVEGSVDVATSAMIRQHQVYGQSRVEAEKLQKAAADLVVKYHRQVELQTAIALHGRDSAQVEQLKRDAAVRAADALIEQEGFSGKVAQQVRAAALAAHDAEVNAANAARALQSAETAARGLAAAIASAAGYSANLEDGVRVLEAEIGALERGADAAIASGLEAKRIRAENMRDAQVSAGQDRLIADSQLAIDLAAIDRQEVLLGQKKRLIEANRKSGSSGAAASRNSVAGILQEIAHRRTLLSLTGDQRAKYEAIIQVQRRLGKEVAKVSKAQISALADQLVQMDKLQAEMDRIEGRAQDISGQITDVLFNRADAKDTARDMAETFAAEFLRTKFILPVVGQFLGLQGVPSGILGGAGGSIGGSGGGGLLGGAGNLLNLGGSLFGTGGFVPGVASGLGGVFSGGGLGSSFANLSGLATGSVSGAGAFGAALPALGILAGGIAALASAFKNEYDGRAVRGTLGPGGFEGREFDFWDGGWLRGDTVEYHDTRTEIQEQLDGTAQTIRANVRDMAAALGLGSDAIRDFTGEQFTIWLSGPNAGSQEDIAAALERELSALGDGMADLVLGTAEYARAGESSYETLTRLGSGLIAVNDAMDLLQVTAFETSVAAADRASQLVDAFGGVEAMSSSILAYWNAFYSEAERQETTIRRLREQFADLNLTMPETREGFRALVESIDLSSESGAQLYAELIGLSGAMDQILPQVGQFSAAMTGLLGQISGELSAQVDIAKGLANDSKQAADLWYKTATTLRDFLSDLLNTNLTSASRSQAHAVNKSRFDTAFNLARGGDVEAARDIPELAKAYLASAQASASSSLEYRRIAAAVQGQVKFLSGIAELEGANDDILHTLYNQQIEVLTSLGNFLQLEGLTEAQVGELTEGVQALHADWGGTVTAFESSLGALEEAIRGAEAFSYDDLVGRLDVAVALADNAPTWLHRLVDRADSGIRTTLDFVIRQNDLTPDMRWLAVNSVSEHVTSLDFILRNDVSTQTRRLALSAGSELRRNIHFIVGTDLSDDMRRIALAGNSELSRVVNVALNELGSDQRALNLALANVGGYAVTVSGAFEDNQPGRLLRRLLRNSGSYSAMVEAAILHTDEDTRRILLRRQGRYVANIRAALDDNRLTVRARGLLLNDRTEAIRRITLRTTGLTAENQSLIDAINGGKSLITLAGRFRFEPTAAFSTYFDQFTNGSDTLTTSMTTLGGYLDQLRQAVDADRAQREVAALEARGATLAADLAANKVTARNAASELRALFEANGITSVGGNFRVQGGQLVSNADHWATSGSWEGIMSALADTYGASGGTLRSRVNAILEQINDPITSSRDSLQRLRAQYRELTGNAPSFAGGGDQRRTGFAHIGENDLELVAPSRIYNPAETKAMLDNRELLKEIKALREEVAALRKDKHRADYQKIKDQKESTGILRRMQVDGIKTKEAT